MILGIPGRRVAPIILEIRSIAGRSNVAGSSFSCPSGGKVPSSLLMTWLAKSLDIFESAFASSFDDGKLVLGVPEGVSVVVKSFGCEF